MTAYFKPYSNQVAFTDNAAVISLRKNTLWYVCATLVFIIAFLLHYHYLLNSFYHFGAPFNDAGILANISWHSDWKLTPPIVYTNYSFFGIHCMPLFVLLTGLSYLVDAQLPEFYSTFIATIYASFSLVLFYIMTVFANLRRSWQIVGSALVAFAFAFHAIIMNGIWIGHFEYAMPLGILLFCIGYIQRRNWLIALAFIFTLSLREDGGMQLTAVLGLIASLRFFATRKFKNVRMEALLVIVAVGCSLLSVWITLVTRNYFGSNFESIYSGTPAFAHVTWSLLWERLILIFREHIHLWSGFLLTLFLAVRTRNAYLMIGYAAYVPWFILNWIAINPNTGYIYAYYTFPFLLSSAWPLLGVALAHGFPLPRTEAMRAVKLQIALVLLGLLMWNNYDKNFEFGPTFGARWGSYAIQKGTLNRETVRSFIAKFEGGAGDLGTVIGDGNVLSLIKSGKYGGEHLLRLDTKKSADTVLYMLFKSEETAPEVLEAATKNKLSHHYCMPDTTICLFTNRSASELGVLRYMVEEL